MKKPAKPKRPAPVKTKVTADNQQRPLKSYILKVNREGKLVLTEELMESVGVKIGDEYATWEEGADLRMVFPKKNPDKRKIPKHAQWGKVEPVLAEIPVRSPKSAKATKVKKP